MISFKGMGRFSLIVTIITAVLALGACADVEIRFRPPTIPGEPTPGVLPYQAPTQTAPQPVPDEETAAIPIPTETTQTYKPVPRKKAHRRPLSDVAHFQHFNVKVDGYAGRPDYATARAEVCLVDDVKGAPTRISRDPWSVITTSGKRVKASKHDAAGEVGNYPTGKYREGECAYGWMQFNTNGMKVKKIRYHNSLGDFAEWTLDGDRIR